MEPNRLRNRGVRVARPREEWESIEVEVTLLTPSGPLQLNVTCIDKEEVADLRRAVEEGRAFNGQFFALRAGILAVRVRELEKVEYMRHRLAETG